MSETKQERAARLTAAREHRAQMRDLQRRVEEGDPEAIEAEARTLNAMGKIMADWLESVRPAFNRIIKVMDQPEVRAWLEERREP